MNPFPTSDHEYEALFPDRESDHHGQTLVTDILHTYIDALHSMGIEEILADITIPTYIERKS